MNTRFNPTANGCMHLGHLYLVLVNYWTAKHSGGRFIVRFDDDQPYWVARLGRMAIDRCCESIQEDLDWMGIKPDLVTFESLAKQANEVSIGPLEPLPAIAADGIFSLPRIVGCDRPYPYVPYLTASKVVQDYREGVNCIIRGDDLVSEFALYCYFCDRLNIVMPDFYYVPKLLHQGSDLSDVSKSDGRFKLADLRQEGYRPDEVEALLARCCLNDSAKGWCYENVRRYPRLVFGTRD